MSRTTLSIFAFSLVVGVAFAAPTLPTFPKDYSSQETVTIYQDGVRQLNASVYYNLSKNRTAMYGSNGRTTVYEFTKPEYYVIEDGTCQFYCGPINAPYGCDLEDSLCVPSMKSATYGGQTTFKGKTVDVFTWTEGLFPIVENAMTLYTVPNEAIPVYMTRNITLVGKYVGLETTEWTTFHAGPPPDSAFDIPGKANCQEADDDETGDCGDSSSQHALLSAVPELASLVERFPFLRSMVESAHMRITSPSLRD